MAEAGDHLPIKTIMFTDLVGSTRLLERLGDDAADAVRRRHFEQLRAAVAEWRGREVKALGDGLMVAFDSAVSAVRCALEIQRVAAEDPEVSVRIGLDAGEPIDDEGDLYGTPVVVARRLCDSAAGGQILLSDLVHRLTAGRVLAPTRPIGMVAIRGLSRPVQALVIDVDSGRRRWGPGPGARSSRRLLRGGRRAAASAATAVVAAAIVVALEAGAANRASSQTTRPDGSVQVFANAGHQSAEHPCYLGRTGRLLFTLFTDGYDNPANIGSAILYTVPSAGGPLRTVITHSGNANINAPSGCEAGRGQIAFSSDVGRTDNVFTAALAGVNRDEHQVTCYSDPTLHAVEPSVSPDGRTVAFALVEDRHHGRSTLWTVPAANRCSHPVAPRALVPASGACRRGLTGNVHQPSWAPDGRMIDFQHQPAPPDGPIQVWTVRPDGCALTQITRGASQDTDPTFSPDSRRIVYSTDFGAPTGIPNLFIVEARPRAVPVRLTSQCYYDGAPAWSPDGRWIAYETWPVLNPGGADIPTALWRIPASTRPGPPSC